MSEPEVYGVSPLTLMLNLRRRFMDLRERNAWKLLSAEEKEELASIERAFARLAEHESEFCRECGQPLGDPRRDVVLMREGEPLDRFGPFESSEAADTWRLHNAHCFDGELQIVPVGETL